MNIMVLEIVSFFFHNLFYISSVTVISLNAALYCLIE